MPTSGSRQLSSGSNVGTRWVHCSNACGDISLLQLSMQMACIHSAAYLISKRHGCFSGSAERFSSSSPASQTTSTGVTSCYAEWWSLKALGAVGPLRLPSNVAVQFFCLATPCMCHAHVQVVRALQQLPTDVVASEEELQQLTAHELKQRLSQAGGTCSNCLEKPELVRALLEVGGSSGDSCCICCEDYTSGDVVRVLPCKVSQGSYDHGVVAIAAGVWAPDASESLPCSRGIASRQVAILHKDLWWFSGSESDLPVCQMQSQHC